MFLQLKYMADKSWGKTNSGQKKNIYIYSLSFFIKYLNLYQIKMFKFSVYLSKTVSNNRYTFSGHYHQLLYILKGFCHLSTTL